jgi:hypothetical protein
MELSPIAVGMVFVALLLVVLRVSMSTKGAKKVRRRSHRGTGAGASGAFYELLSEDKRKAIEIIVEQKAGARDEETADDIVDPDQPDEGGEPRERR